MRSEIFLYWTPADIIIPLEDLNVGTDLPGQVDSQNRVNGDADGSKKSAVPHRYQQFVTSEDETGSSSAHSSDEEEEEEVQKDRTTVKSTSMSAVPPTVKVEAPVSPAPVKERLKVCLMLIKQHRKKKYYTHTGFFNQIFIYSLC